MSNAIANVYWQYPISIVLSLDAIPSYEYV